MNPIETLMAEKMKLKERLDAINPVSVRDEMEQRNLAYAIDEYNHAIAVLQEDARITRRIMNRRA